MLGGFLKPTGEWVELPHYGHRDWAHDELDRLGITEYGFSAIDKLQRFGYLQISMGYVFLTDHSGNDLKSMDLTAAQLSFLLEHAGDLDTDTKRHLMQFYGLVFPGVHVNWPTDDLQAPGFSAK